MRHILPYYEIQNQSTYRAILPIVAGYGEDKDQDEQILALGTTMGKNDKLCDKALSQSTHCNGTFSVWPRVSSAGSAPQNLYIEAAYAPCTDGFETLLVSHLRQNCITWTEHIHKKATPYNTLKHVSRIT